MAFGGDYARIYDRLYADKAYAADAAFALDLLRSAVPAGATMRHVLDIGCGTARHALHLAQAGHDVTGIDQSLGMIAEGRARVAAAPCAGGGRIKLAQGDIRSVDLGVRFDAALSLFHVFSYLTSDDDLRDGFRGVRRHLRAGAPFAFDFWHGPAIDQDGPQDRDKVVEDEDIHIRRQTRPVWQPAQDRVDVHYHLTIRDKNSGLETTSSEVHRLRYLYPARLAPLLDDAGFRVLRCVEWLTGNVPDRASFSVCLLAQAR
ncbi:class I SAM-dependent DNA methyltransferase [Zavarzinia sp. CC-PAN008]|uniref:class I SAM-dependent DNA methyltransferase n=1 Tax=Zavarzinia sp. CC-PAN008 TaxID=3243332 RepID=UPI003F74339F